MQINYSPPKFKGWAFHCPLCAVYANFHWGPLYERSDRGGFGEQPMYKAVCAHCFKATYWFESDGSGRMVEPSAISAPMPHQDLPSSCRADFLEAREVASVSPRSAAALLRLCLQRLCVDLGQTGKNLNGDIAALVKNGLPMEIQQALDIVRVTGNNAVHPGEISFDDNPEIVVSLFSLINLVVDNRIAQPKLVAQMFSALPASAQQAITKRDGSEG